LILKFPRAGNLTENSGHYKRKRKDTMLILLVWTEALQREHKIWSNKINVKLHPSSISLRAKPMFQIYGLDKHLKGFVGQQLFERE